MIIYADRDYVGDNIPYDDIPIDCTVGNLLTTIINTDRAVEFGDLRLNELDPNTLLADIGLCNEMSIYIRYFKHDRFMEEWESFILELKDKKIRDDSIWKYITLNPLLQMDFVVAHIDLPWEWSSLHYNPNFDFDLVWDYPDLPWCYTSLSCHKKLSMDVIIELQHKPWDWHSIQRLSQFDIDIIKKIPDVGWNYYELSTHKDLTMELVRLFPDKEWSWYSIARQSFERDRVRLNGSSID